MSVEIHDHLNALHEMCKAGLKEIKEFGELPPQTYKDIKFWFRHLQAHMER